MRMPSCFVAGALGLGLCAQASAAATFFGPTPYTSFTGSSPFAAVPFVYRHVETFEGAPTPGYSATTGGVILGPGGLVDSVDADDGAIDGSGTGGRSWFSNASTGVFTFTFDAAVLGALPTHVGIVWTDVGNVSVPPPPEGPPGVVNGVSLVSFEAFGPGAIGAVVAAGPFLLGDGAVGGATAEDRFLGVSRPEGISSIVVRTAFTNDWEVDHLQYIQAVPEPAQWLMMALGLGAIGWRWAKRGR